MDSDGKVRAGPRAKAQRRKGPGRRWCLPLGWKNVPKTCQLSREPVYPLPFRLTCVDFLAWRCIVVGVCRRPIPTILTQKAQRRKGLHRRPLCALRFNASLRVRNNSHLASKKPMLHTRKEKECNVKLGARARCWREGALRQDRRAIATWKLCSLLRASRVLAHHNLSMPQKGRSEKTKNLSKC
jgi:hypothetical protein